MPKATAAKNVARQNWLKQQNFQRARRQPFSASGQGDPASEANNTNDKKRLRIFLSNFRLLRTQRFTMKPGQQPFFV